MAFPSITWGQLIESLRAFGVVMAQTSGGKTMVVRIEDDQRFMHAPPTDLTLPVSPGVFSAFCQALNLDPEIVLQFLQSGPV